ncbi:uncharacterized protein HaLaN_18431, partial [Haematococcus lacustris]
PLYRGRPYCDRWPPMDLGEFVVKPVKDFAKNSARLVKRCTKPDRKAYQPDHCGRMSSTMGRHTTNPCTQPAEADGKGMAHAPDPELSCPSLAGHYPLQQVLGCSMLAYSKYAIACSAVAVHSFHTQQERRWMW